MSLWENQDTSKCTEFETSWTAFKSKTIENKEAMHFQET